VLSDECPVNAAREKALLLGKQLIPPPLLFEMLDFLGFARGFSPHDFGRAVAKYQDSSASRRRGEMTPIQVVRLIQITAVRGQKKAQRSLGIMYVKGVGVVRNLVRAEKWLLAAAEQGDGEAMYALSELYSLGGRGIEKSEDKANRYRQGSAVQGFQPVRSDSCVCLRARRRRIVRRPVARAIVTGTEAAAMSRLVSDRLSETPRNPVVTTSRVWSWSLAVALGGLALTLTLLALPQRAMSYSAAQAEAQTDPSNDPYDFPGIQVCCHAPRPHGPGYCERFPDDPRCEGDGRHGHHGKGRGHGRGDDVVDVDCGAGRRRAGSSRTFKKPSNMSTKAVSSACTPRFQAAAASATSSSPRA